MGLAAICRVGRRSPGSWAGRSVIRSRRACTASGCASTGSMAPMCRSRSSRPISRGRCAPCRRAADGPAVLLGAGGAARAIAVALIDAGAPELRLVNRTPARAEALAGQLADTARQHGAALAVLPWHDGAALSGALLLVNTTSLGMTGQPPLEIDLQGLPRAALV